MSDAICNRHGQIAMSCSECAEERRKRAEQEKQDKK